MGWLEDIIEEGIRSEVKLLRDNGFNTECSCGHEMYVQCQYVIDYEIKRLYDLIYNYLYENKKPINFEINVVVEVMDGHPYPTMQIKFK